MSTANGSEPAAVVCLLRRDLCRRCLLEPLQALLGGGLAPAALARALAVGALLGSMPLPWGTSLICLGVALLLRLNPLAVQAGNVAAWPLQLLLAYPYLRLGHAWFPAASAVAAPDDLLHTLAAAGGVALCAWALTAPLLLPLLYLAGRLLVATVGRFRQSTPGKT
jgi:hypothetical protein